MKNLQLFILFFCFFNFIQCSKVYDGSLIDFKVFKKMEIGKTKKSDFDEILKLSIGSLKDESNNEIYYYGNSISLKNPVFSQKLEYNFVKLTFNKNGILIKKEIFENIDAK